MRRIFPALFAMLAVATIAAILVLFFPTDLVRYAHSLLATAFFGSNFEFWSEAGYFDVIAEDKPLLHLWSIAVEEQFYLLFPAILLLAARWRRSVLCRWRDFCSLIRPASLGASRTRHRRRSIFCRHAPGNCWKGALLALKAVPAVNGRVARQLLAALGIAFIAASVFLYSRDTPFPGPAALLPCLGTALVIYAGDCGMTVAGTILSLSPFVFIGRISYSLYLWHWPLYVFARYLDFRDPSPVTIAVLIAMSFALATLSYAFVEQPFRRAASSFSREKLFAAGGVAMAAGAVAATLLLFGGGLPERLRPDLRTILAEQDDHEARIDTCFGLSAADVRNGRLCRNRRRGRCAKFHFVGATLTPTQSSGLQSPTSPREKDVRDFSPAGDPVRRFST